MKLKFIIALMIMVPMIASCSGIDITIKVDEDIVETKKENEQTEKIVTEKVIVENTEKEKPQKNELDRATLNKVNLFLSNLSEAYYDPDSDYYSDKEGKINFVYLHTKINSQDLILFENGYYGITTKTVDNTLNRFFGKSIQHGQESDFKQWKYEDGKYLIPAADGESYADFSIVTDMQKRTDGMYDVSFNIYSDPSICGGDIITDKSIYSLNDSEASLKYDLVGRGYAVLKDKVRNGKNTYEVVSYSVD